MAGHSHFKNIMRRKGAQDKKRTKMFTRVMREIIVAAKSGAPDPNSNPKLRAAIAAAKAINLPKDKIENAIAKASNPANSENYENVRYEGYAPFGVAVIVEALTDNRNRTASDVRSIFSKNGGNLGESGSVSFLFERVGCITYPEAIASEETIFEATAEAGGVDCASDSETHEIFCEVEKLNEVKEYFSKKYGEPESAKLSWRAKTTMELEPEKMEKISALVETLDDNDDVQDVFVNI